MTNTMTDAATHPSSSHRVTLIPGDGIGPEISHAVQRILAASGVRIAWEEMPMRGEVECKGGDYLEDFIFPFVKETRVALKGPLATAVATGAPSFNVAIRQELELFANLRPVNNLQGVNSVFKNVDIVIVRENTEDLYAGLEHTVVPGVVESLKIITEKASTRIAEFAFEYAVKHARQKIHGIHKANIMKLSDGLFLTSIRKVAARYPQVEYKELIIDNACMQLVLDPHQFDVLLLTNLYGDIMSDLAAGLVGGLGVVPSANIGKDVAVFEAVHGTAPDIAGKDMANPTALLMSAIMMLDHLGEEVAARSLEAALHRVYIEGKHLTRDVGGKSSTTEFTDAVIAAMQSG
jgi:isocitrate dehydrogenase (NAD+)